MIERVQGQAQNAVDTMQVGMENLEEGLALAEASAGENAEVRQIVGTLLSTIDQLTESGRAHAGETGMIGTVAGSMQKAQYSLTVSAAQTRHTIGWLALLAGRFRVSAAGR